MSTPERGFKPDLKRCLDAQDVDALHPAEPKAQQSTEPSTLPRSGTDGLVQYQTREDLEKSLTEEARVRQVIDTIPALAWCNLPDGPNEFMNERWHDYTGLSPQEAHGWGWQGAVHPEDLTKLMDKWLELLALGDPGEIEARIRRHDGVFRWFLIRVEPLRDESRAVVKWYGVAIDIEDRKQAESLRAAENRALEMIADGASLKDILNHLCGSIDVQVSPSVTTVLLMDPDGKHLWPSAGPQVPRKWISVISPVPVAMEGGLCGTAAFLKERVIVTDVATDPNWPDAYRDLAIRNGIRAGWSQPILTRDNQVLGTFALYSAESRVPTDADLTLIEGASRIALIAIERQRSQAALAKAYHELEPERDRLRLLVEVQNALVTNLDLPSLLTGLAARLRRVTECDFVGLSLPDPSGGDLRQHFVYYFEGGGTIKEGLIVPLYGSASGKAFRTRQLVCLDNVKAERPDPEIRRRRTRAPH